jgi:hypothetical protein
LVSDILVGYSVFSQVTRAQKGLTRLHEQLVESEKKLLNLPVLDPKYLHPRRGSLMAPTYAPTATSAPIPYALQEALLNEVRKLINQVEEQGNFLATFGAPLWTSYFEEYKRRNHEESESTGLRSLNTHTHTLNEHVRSLSLF